MSCPQDVFCGVVELAAGEVRGWVGLDPGDAVEDLVSEFSEATCNRKDIMIRSTNPDCTIRF